MLKKYWPLVALIATALLAAGALSVHVHTEQKTFVWMHFFMGFFFCQFALLKLFNPTGFADGFQMYDMIASKSRLYAYLYPLLELGLGLGYLAFFMPRLIYSATIVLLTIGAIGVIRALRKGLDVRCACMGTTLNVPLSTVTLIEDLTMGAMALLLLFSVQ